MINILRLVRLESCEYSPVEKEKTTPEEKKEAYAIKHALDLATTIISFQNCPCCKKIDQILRILNFMGDDYSTYQKFIKE